MRSILEYTVDDINTFAENLSIHVDTVDIGVLLRGKDLLRIPETSIGSNFEILAGVGSLSICKPNNNSFECLNDYYKGTNDWILGYLSYDLKNELEDLQSEKIDGIGFPKLLFFQPEILIIVKSNSLFVHYFSSITSVDKINALISELKRSVPINDKSINSLTFKSRYTKSEFLNTINQVKNHIARGDIYEMNLCQEFYTSCDLDPPIKFNSLYKISPTPFGVFLKVNQQYLISASPERYIRKESNLIISQPIKGTAPRKSDITEDNTVKLRLKADPKERAENVMIVDLVRNDLSRIATRGSVTVNELCGIYSFKQVHQMISTVTCKLQPDLNVIEPIKATFPMGSMTGAPKIRAMQLIENFERTKRGLFSGAVGYITPDGNFDFNVVIRSLLYNKETKYLSFTVGGAITFNSEPEKEYNECLLKAKAILTTLNANIDNAE